VSRMLGKWVVLVIALQLSGAVGAKSALDLIHEEVISAYLGQPTDIEEIEIAIDSAVNHTLKAESKLYSSMVEHAKTVAIPENSRPQHTEIATSLRSKLRMRGRAGVSAMQTQSLMMCAERLNRDIADGLSDELIESAKTGLVSILIDGIVVIICMIVVALTFIFLLSTADKQGNKTVENFNMTVNPALMAVVWPLMENDATINLVDQATTALMNAITQKARYRLTVTIANYLSDVVSMHLYRYVIEEELPVLVAGVAHRTLHAVVLSLSRSLTRSFVHTIPRYVRGVLAKNTVKLFYCVYCYREGQFCSYCFGWNSFGDPQKTKSMEPDMFMVKTEGYYDV